MTELWVFYELGAWTQWSLAGYGDSDGEIGQGRVGNGYGVCNYYGVKNVWRGVGSWGVVGGGLGLIN
jgi:hypothetical protein